jgi:hypothetical protein
MFNNSPHPPENPATFEVMWENKAQADRPEITT